MGDIKDIGLLNVCMECGYEWNDSKALACPKCGGLDYYIDNELNYADITLEECFVLYHKDKFACECNADLKLVIATLED